MTQEDALLSSLKLGESERWYVARTLPQRELQAARQLANQDFRTFVPLFPLHMEGRDFLLEEPPARKKGRDNFGAPLPTIYLRGGRSDA